MPQTMGCQIVFNLHPGSPVVGGERESVASRAKPFLLLRTPVLSGKSGPRQKGPGGKAVFLPWLSEELSLSSVVRGSPLALGSTAAPLRI